MAKCELGDQIICHITNNSIISAYEEKWEEEKIFEIIAIADGDYVVYVPFAMPLKDAIVVDSYNCKKLNLEKKFLGSNVCRITDLKVIGVYKKLDGMKCSRCQDFHHMASANQLDNTFTCFLCRNYRFR